MLASVLNSGYKKYIFVNGLEEGAGSWFSSLIPCCTVRRKINVYLLYRAIWGAGELNKVINIYLHLQHQNSILSFCKEGGGGGVRSITINYLQ